MSEKIAIDVALLLPEEVVGIVTSINDELVSRHNSPIRFGKGGSLPHITLAMACVSRSDIKEINERLAGIACVRKALSLQLESFSVDEELPTNERVSSFSIQNSVTIRELQRSVREGLTPFFSHELSREMLFRPDDVSYETFEWMKKYVHDFPRAAAFNPHLTIGIGTTRPAISLPLPFTASELALCHLGNNCTCNTVLGSHTLQVSS